MKHWECWPLDEIFTHEDTDVTPVRIRHFNASAMRRWAYEYLEKCLEADVRPVAIELTQVFLDPEQTAHIKAHRGIERWKVDRLCEPHLSEPILGVALEDGTHLTVDGHHRWVRLAERGDKVITAILFPVGLWESFLVEDCDDITLAKLAVAEEELKKRGLLPK